MDTWFPLLLFPYFVVNTSSAEERLVYCTSTHWMKYLFNGMKNFSFILFGILLLSASNIAVLKGVSSITFMIGCMLILYATHHFFHKLMSESMYDIFVTTERVIYFDDSLFILNDEHEIPLHRVAGIEVSQNGLIQNVLNYGTLWVDTGGSTIDFRRSIPYVPNPEGLNAIMTKQLQSSV